MREEIFYVYVLENRAIEKLYIGYSSELLRRLEEHRNGKSKFTSQDSNWNLLFQKECESKSEAISFERKLKKWKNRERVLAWITREKAQLVRAVPT